MRRRLIDANVLNDELINRQYSEQTMGISYSYYPQMRAIVAKQPTVNAMELPCKIGDTVWFAKQYKCHRHPRQGVVSEMYFVKEGDEMSLHVVVKSIGRGKWGERVFGTCEEAQAAIDGWST